MDAEVDDTIRVSRLQPADHARWDAFVSRHPGATFCHRAGWQTVIERSFGHETHFLLAERSGRIEGILPLARVRSLLFGHSLVSLPFCVYGGIVAETPEAGEALDAAAQALAGKHGVDHLEYRHLQAPRHPEWPASDLYVTFRKPIEPDVDANMQAIPRKQRRMVRQGIKAGLSSGFDDGVERFFRIFSQNVHRMGTPVFPRRYFQALKDVFGDDCRILTVTRDGEPVSTVMTFYFRDEVLPYYGAGMPLAREVAGYDFLYWELMRRACEDGYRTFDYGRSKRGTGSFSFKKNWGFEAQPLYYEFHLHKGTAIPQNNPLNPKYQLLIKLWQRLPLPVANMLGPHVVKNLG